MERAVRVLAVDDEPSLLRLIERYLMRSGYVVSAFDDPRAALEAFESDPVAFEAAVIDMEMPTMHGIDLARRMFRQNPQFRVLLCSGYPFDMGELEATERARSGFLQKPFLPGMLSEALGELLRRESG